MRGVVGEADDFAHHLGIGRGCGHAVSVAGTAPAIDAEHLLGALVHDGGIGGFGEEGEAVVVPVALCDHVHGAKARRGAAAGGSAAAGTAARVSGFGRHGQGAPGFGAAIAVHGDLSLALEVAHGALASAAKGTVQRAGVVAQ